MILQILEVRSPSPVVPNPHPLCGEAMRLGHRVFAGDFSQLQPSPGAIGAVLLGKGLPESDTEHGARP